MGMRLASWSRPLEAETGILDSSYRLGSGNESPQHRGSNKRQEVAIPEMVLYYGEGYLEGLSLATIFTFPLSTAWGLSPAALYQVAWALG